MSFPPDVRQQLALLTAALEELPRFEAPRALLEALPALLARQGEGHVSVWLPEGGDFRLLAACGFEPQQMPNLPVEGVVGRAYRLGQPVYVADVTQDPAYILLEGHPMTSELALPLWASGEVVAVLNLERTHPFAQAEREGFRRFALAVGQQLTRLYERQRFQLLSQLGEGLASAKDTQEAARQLLSLLVPALEVSAGAVLLQQGSRLRPLAAEGHFLEEERALLAEGIPYGPGLSWQALRSGQPIYRGTCEPDAPPRCIFDTAEVQALAVHPVPLGHRRPARVLLALRDTRPRRWPQAEQDLLAAACRTLGLSLATLVGRERLVALLALARAAVEGPPESVYQRVVEAAVQLVPGAEAGSLLLKGEEAFTFRAALGYDLESLAAVRLIEADQQTWYAGSPASFYRGEPRILRRGEVDITQVSSQTLPARLADRAARVGEIQTNLALPVPYQGEVLALLNLDNFHDPGAFGEDSLEAARLFAPAVAALLHELRHRRLLEEAALTDALTGLANRRAFDRFFAEELSRARRYDYPLALLVMDLKGFKRINDELGHLAGDQALTRVARVLSQERRPGDRYFRWGGDEFAALLPHTAREGAAAAARRVAYSIGAIHLEGRSLGVSIGVAAFPHDGRDEDALLIAADRRMYLAKDQGIAVYAD